MRVTDCLGDFHKTMKQTSASNGTTSSVVPVVSKGPFFLWGCSSGKTV